MMNIPRRAKGFAQKPQFEIDLETWGEMAKKINQGNCNSWREGTNFWTDISKMRNISTWSYGEQLYWKVSNSSWLIRSRQLQCTAVAQGIGSASRHTYRTIDLINLLLLLLPLLCYQSNSKHTKHKTTITRWFLKFKIFHKMTITRSFLDLQPWNLSWMYIS